MRSWTEEDDKKRKEEREFQIALAEFQADVQIWLSFALELLAIFIAILIVIAQIYFVIPARLGSTDMFVLFLLIIIGIAMLFFYFIFIWKADKARKKISELRKQYVDKEKISN